MKVHHGALALLSTAVVIAVLYVLNQSRAQEEVRPQTVPVRSYSLDSKDPIKPWLQSEGELTILVNGDPAIAVYKITEPYRQVDAEAAIRQKAKLYSLCISAEITLPVRSALSQMALMMLSKNEAMGIAEDYLTGNERLVLFGVLHAAANACSINQGFYLLNETFQTGLVEPSSDADSLLAKFKAAQWQISLDEIKYYVAHHPTTQK